MTVAPYGSWTSSITPEKLLGSTKFQQLFTNGKAVYVVEGRPREAGRCAIVKIQGDAKEDILPVAYSARSKVHEYGGAPCNAKNETLYFVNGEDQNIHIMQDGDVSFVVTDPGIRYADLHIHPSEKWIYAIQEEHTREEKVINTLALVHLDTENESQVIHSGYDFYTKPRISPDGKRLAFLAWNKPHMPWDETILFVGTIKNDGTIENVQKVAGGKGHAVNQVAFGPDGTLYYSLDTSGWWDIYSENGLLLANEHDFGYPDWVFGVHRMVFCGDKLIAVGTKKGLDSLFAIDPKTKDVKRLELPFTAYYTLCSANWKIYAVAASPKSEQMVIEIDTKRETSRPLYSFSSTPFDEKTVSLPQTVETGDAFGYYYPPNNPEYTAPEGEKPPLIVSVHGGPTGHKDNTLRLATQFWTTRGFGFLEVNHRGSTGNGRVFRDMLKGQWGVVDVEDTAHLAQHLSQIGMVDGARMIVTGGSAGGCTALNCLAMGNDFAGGISLYGIGDLEHLAKDTHKFESHTIEYLVGKYPEEKEKYRARSSINLVDSIHAPLLLLQGIEDKVVPPSQSERIHAKLLEKGVPIAFILFEGEGHGFRKGETIIRSYGSMLAFARRIFSIHTDEQSEDIHIDNLDD